MPTIERERDRKSRKMEAETETEKERDTETKREIETERNTGDWGGYCKTLSGELVSIFSIQHKDLLTFSLDKCGGVRERVL